MPTFLNLIPTIFVILSLPDRQEQKFKSKLESLEKKNATKTLEGATFEEIGCDAIFVDEAHYFKNLAVSGGSVPGMQTSDAAKCEDLLMKCEYLRDNGRGNNIVFATGTPVTNTMAELYNMQRYLSPNLLDSQGVSNFSAWAKTFGEVTETLEPKPEGGGLDIKRRFTRFQNLPELMSSFHCCSDIMTADDLDLDLPELESHAVAVPATPEQLAEVEALVERGEKVHAGCDPSMDNMLKITGDGRKVALDPKLLYLEEDPDMEPLSGGKVDACVRNILDIRRRTEAERGAQLHVLNVLDDIAWVLNVRGGDVLNTPVVMSYLVIGQKHVNWFVDEAKVDDAMRKTLADEGVNVRGYDEIIPALKGLEPDVKVLADASKLTAALMNALEKAEIIRAENPSTMMKAIKNDVELDNLRRAHVKDGVAVTRLMYWLKQNVGKIPMTEISVSDKLLALRQGEVDFSVAKVADFASFTSEVKVLAVYNQERLEGYPDVPTMGELGYYDQWLGSSRCIVAPAGTPENVIKFYEDAFQKLMEDADYLKAAEAAGMETDYKNSADTAALIKQQQDFTESLADVWGD